MKHLLCITVFAICMGMFYGTLAQGHRIEVNITVPEFKVDKEDAYVCVSALLPPHPHKLIGVIPHARKEVVHHILLYGCSEPHLAPSNNTPQAWRCDMKPVCNGPSTILYGWGRDAPDLRLPDGVGFSVGELTGIRYIVAQVHYLAIRPPDDHSGLSLVLKPHPVPYAAGLMSYASWFEIPPGKKSHLIRNTCCFKSHQPLTMFAVRVHTHLLGRRVYMTRQIWNGSGSEELISRDPQLPQSFVPSNRHMLWPGDRLTVTCDFDSTSRTTPTSAGATHNDEMCNMYVMVYGKTPYMTMCSDNELDIRDDSPGALPRSATFTPDPAPFWKPPAPEGVEGVEGGRFGDATSVTTGPDGALWVLYRASGVWSADTFDTREHITRTSPVPEAVVAVLDPDNGTVLARWGAGLTYLPHSITVDAEGSVWITDVGRHQVLKFTREGKLLMSVGVELTPGAGQGHFCKPTHVAVLLDGSFLVADGYCNSRVVWFDRQGNYLAESGRVDSVVHSLLLDECEGLVYVASREAGAVVALYLDPKRRLQRAATYDLAEHGLAWSLRFGPYGEQLALMWREGQDARLVNVRFPQQFWTLPLTAALSPHDFTLGGAPAQLSGAGDRLFAVYLASVGVVCDTKCGPIRKFVAVPPGVNLPQSWDLPDSTDLTDLHPGDAVELPHGALTGATGSTGRSDSSGGTDTNPAGKGAGGGGGEDKGGAMVADDYDESIEEDVVDAEDYEEEVREEDEDELKELKEAEADYMEMVTGERPDPDSLVAKPQPVPLQTDRFEVLVQDQQTVNSFTSLSPWTIVVVAIVALAIMVVVLRFSRHALAAYMQPPGEEGQGAGLDGEEPAPGAGSGTGAGRGLLVSARKMLKQWAGLAKGVKAGAGRVRASGGGAAAAEEVAAARERERLLGRVV